MPNSKVLVLTIACNAKTAGGSRLYDASTSIVSSLPGDKAELLIEGRRCVHSLIARKAISRNGVSLADLPYNQSLVDGPDFNGIVTSGLYMPAAKRYRGRFYTELGPNGPFLLTNSRHHVLISSGLYGLLTPSELIQCYSCYVNDHSDIHRYWTENDCLTEVLGAYIDQYGITQVLDLTGEAAYRNLFAWETIRSKAKVLHCFGEQNAGPAVLRALAVLAREFLEKAPDEAVSKIQDGTRIRTPYEGLLFWSSPKPPAGAPQEFELHKTMLNTADELGRMRRNIIRILIQLEGLPRKTEGVVARIDALTQRKHLDPREACLMRSVVKVRNKVEYEEYSVTPQELSEVREAYTSIQQWALNKGIKNLEEV